MDTSKLEIGKEYKNYKELCKILGEPIKEGNSKKSQLKKWEEQFQFKKDGQRITVTSIMNTPNTKTLSEIIEEFGTDKIKAYYKDHKKLNAGITRQLNNRLTERMNYSIKNGVYYIEEIYDTPLPLNIGKMKTGLYQYIVPLVLQGIMDSESNIVALTVHKLARNIDMINKNYDIIKYNKDIFSDEYDEGTLVDYFSRIDDSIKYYIQNAVELLAKAHVIDYSYVNYIQLKRNEIELNKESSIVENEEEQVNRRATDEENVFKFDLEQKAMEIAGIDPLKEGVKACYYGKKAKRYHDAYNFLLEEENKKRGDYKIEKFYKTYELVASDKRKCEQCLSYFDTENIVENFNNHFMKSIIDNAKKRKDGDEKGIKYDTHYINDYSNLVLETVPKTRDSLLQDEVIKEEIRKKNQEYLLVKKTRKFSTKEKNEQ